MTTIAFGLLLASAAHAADPCALRTLVDKPSSELAALVERATDPRAHACVVVVYANALAREGHGGEAAARFDEAMDALPEIANAIELAKRRSTSAPPAPAVERAPASDDEAAQLVMRLVREAKPKRAVAIALEHEKRAPRPTVPNEAFEVATLTALVRADRNDEAVARAAALPVGDGYVKARAWVLGKAKQHDHARDLYAALASTSSDPALKAEAAFLSAFTAYDNGDVPDARARFAAALDAVKGTAFEGTARWYLALCDLLRGRWREAVPVLELLVSEMPGEREALKHRYWLARARLELAALDPAAADGRAQAALGRAELVALADSEPLEFYGMLSRRRLGKSPIKGAKVAADAMMTLARDDEDARKVLLLWNLGLDDEARTFARGLGESAKDIGLQHKVGDAAFGWRRGGRFIPHPPTRKGVLVKDPRWRVSYAAPWRDVVAAAARGHAVPTSFLYAIMRTESGFDARAISVAGALGVIQLLPSAATGAAALAGRPIDDARRVFDPPVAIDLGAALLGAGLKEFGSLALAAAAYNGGAPNVASWMREHGSLDAELFIERIPFKETRDYVKRVTAVEATYRALAGGDLALNLPMSIPPPPPTFTHFPMDE
jgi:soluble lytic murein transglycosylase